MKARVSVGLAGASLFAMATTTNAQTESGSGALPDGAKRGGVEEIIVTARRRDESLQDVPQTVDAVTAESIEKLNLVKFEDIQAVVPGLSLSNNSNFATGAAAGMRGISFEARTTTSPTVEFYLNDTPIQTGILFNSLFDVAQIEVLRGPQGTLRGRASPSGAITVTTRKPDLSEFGGYAMGSGTNRDGNNVQAAVNLPVISDVLAFRIAANYDENELDGVRSIYNGTDPNSETKTGRVSLGYQPTDGVLANLNYQYLERDVTNYIPVVGTGSAGQAGGPVIVNGSPRFPYTQNPTLAPNYNGPAIAAGDRRSVQDTPSTTNFKIDILNATIDWHVAGQRLSYVGGYQKQDLVGVATADAGNILTGVDAFQATQSAFTQKSHELRLASEERLAGRFDYTVGLFYAQQNSDPTNAQQAASYLSGAFGSPGGAANPSILDQRYVANTLILRASHVEEKSAFASATWHITDATEFTAGGRYIINKNDSFTGVSIAPALFALPLSQISPALLACAGGFVGSTYAGFGDVPAGCVSPSLAPGPRSPITHDAEDKPFVYNVQLSHQFDERFMAYANVASSWRRGVSVLGIFNADNDPLIASLTNLDPEKSRSYELGLKSTFWDNRARVNVAVYHQDFDGLIFKSTQPIQYLANSGTGLAPTFFEFINSADAVVDGIDLDAALQLTPQWNASFSASYADGHVDDDLVPCNDPTVTLTPTQRVAVCRSSETISNSPQWNATLQSEYSMPVMARMEGYVRGLFTYYPKNDEQLGFQAGSYGLLNVYLGVRDPDSAWDVTLFAKNVTNTEETLNIGNFGQFQDARVLGTGFFGDPGYAFATYTPRREVGLQVRYAFGSR